MAHDENVTAKTIRENCLECSGGDARYVTWCPCDGLHSTACRFWKARFGMRPASFRAKYGDRLLTPELMPPANVELELLPAFRQTAAFAEIDIPGYHAPALEPPSPPELSADEQQKRAEARERMRRLHQRPR